MAARLTALEINANQCYEYFGAAHFEELPYVSKSCWLVDAE